MPDPQITYYVKLSDLLGVALPGGSITVQLSGYGSQIPRVAGTAMIAKPSSLPIFPDVDGIVAQRLWGNDVITPAGTYYTFVIADDQGNVVQVNAYRFIGAGTYDLSTATPYDPDSPNPPDPPAPPIPTVSRKPVWASELGCALDAVSGTGTKAGGGEATNDGPLIRSLLSTSSLSNPVSFLIDGWTLVSGLFTGATGYISIEGLGWQTGFFQKSGTNNDVIHNGIISANVPTDPGARTSDLPMAPPARGGNMVLKNFAINGNRGNGFNGNSTTGQVQGVGHFVFPPEAGWVPGAGSYGLTWYFGINVMNLDSVELDHIKISNTSSFATRFSNVGSVIVRGCRITPAATPVDVGNNGDGIHISGYCDDVFISDTYFHTSDDAIGINSVEGFCGPIYRVVVTNCTFDLCQSALRLYCNGRYDSAERTITGYIETFSMSNCIVNSTVYAMVIGLAVNGTRYNVEQIQHAIFTGNRFYCQQYGVALICDNVGLLQFNDCIWTAPTQGTFGNGFANMVFDGATISQLEFNSVTINRDSFTTGLVTPLLQMGIAINFPGSGTNAEGGPPAHHIHRLVLDGVRYAQTQGVNNGVVPFLLNIEPHCTIDQLVIESLDPTGVASLFNPDFGFPLGCVISGSGVLATGWTFPDASMANGVPYLSASTGLPVIKIFGIIYAYGTPAAPPPTDSLAFYSPMTETSGSTFAETVHAATLTATAGSWTSARTALGLSNSAVFNGTGYADAANHTGTDIERTSPFSIALDATFANSNTKDMLFCAATVSAGYYLYRTDTGTVDFRMYGGAGALEVRSVAEAASSINLRYSIVVTYDGSSTAAGVKIYVNGNLLALNINADTLAASILSGANVRIGADYAGASKHAGALRAVRLYSRVLTASEVISIAYEAF